MTGTASDPPIGGYELVDSGRRRKLERFGSRLLDRPCPQATWERSRPAAEWRAAGARFERRRGWAGAVLEPSEWPMRFAGLTFQLALGRSGQVGLFPEHRACWRWIGQRLGREDRLLNLFAHTGGATLVAARAGAAVCHVDGSRPAVARARENAAASGLDSKPVRWIVDDVAKFVAREIRRGNRHDAVILDPPAFGRGPRGERWKLEEVLDDTLEQVFRLLSETPRFVLLSAHSRGLERDDLAERLGRAAMRATGRTTEIAAGELRLAGDDGVRPVPSGHWVAWEPTA